MRNEQYAPVGRCGNGHRLTPENTYTPPGQPNVRKCRVCRAAWQSARPTTRHARYTGRGREWARKLITKRAVKQVARYRAGLILESVINEGWEPPDLIKRHGEDGVEEIRKRIMFLATWFIDTGHPDGDPGAS